MFEAKQVSLDDLPQGPGGRILRPAEAEAWQKGHRFLAAVRTTANRIEEAARETYAAEYARGYAEGRSAGAAEATRLLGETALKVDRYLAALQPEISSLALEIARQVFGELDVRELVARAAIQALEQFRREKCLKVTVHPTALDLARAALAAHLEGAGPTIIVESDPALGKGACVVASDFAVVDASIETQLQALATALGAAG
ncbi:MAG: type III secretion system stator protein SctL [Acetobacteraceae bacterium]|nr:type III secretion system stator protein SctL [Acetobacteraceae bacterium]